MTDEQLLRGMQAQQPEAMEALMKKYHRYIQTVIANILSGYGKPEDTEELVQDAFYSVWTHAEAISGGKLRAYLRTTARNKAKSWLRGRRELPMALDTIEIPDPDGSLEDAAEQEELAGVLQRAIGRMRPKDREIFLRYYYYLQTAAEIAEQMDMSLNTVLSRLMRGRKQLKKTLSKEDFS